ncbi:MAG: hypothetical protein AB1664_02880 [Thermodesulfobacteriota bacterium]
MTRNGKLPHMTERLPRTLDLGWLLVELSRILIMMLAAALQELT